MPPTQKSPDRQQSQQQQTQIRVHLLEEDNLNHGKLFRLKQGWLLRPQPSNKIIHKKISKNTNGIIYQTVYPMTSLINLSKSNADKLDHFIIILHMKIRAKLKALPIF